MNAVRASVLAALILMTCFGFAHAAVPTITAGSATVNVGDTFDIAVSMSSPSEVDSWQFDLAFTATLLKANSVTEGPFLSELGTKTTLFGPGVIDNGTGHITLVTDSFVDLPPGPSGSGVIADISFTALAAGVSPLTLSNVFLNDLDSGFVTTNGQVTINGPRVPEPTMFTLVALGLGTVLGVHRRRMRSHRV